MQKIIPNLWFNRNAEEAVGFYLSIFKDGKINSTSHYPKTAEEGLADFQKDFAGKVLTIDFEIGGYRLIAINADETFKPTPAISLWVPCKDQKEIDYYWEKLSANPSFEQCGWLQDKYGISWQIAPENIDELIQLPGAYQRMMNMKKIDIADLSPSYSG